MVDKYSAPAYSMGHSKVSEKNTAQKAPGPGSYDHSSTLRSSKSGSNIKTTEQRFKNQLNQIPGPGTYNSMETSKQHGPNAIILSRNKLHAPQLAPGPGSYEPNYKKLIKSESGFKIGHSQKIGDTVGQNKKMPGPCQYETNKSTVLNNHAMKIGSQKRGDMVLNKFTPGPGQYNETKIDNSIMKAMPKVIFGKSGRSLSSANIIPAGAYSITDKFSESVSKTKGFSISAKHHQQAYASEKQPGPGAYNTQQLDKLKHKIISFSVGKAPKLKIQNEKQIISNPGPQNYSYKNTAYESKNCVFGKQKRATLGNEAAIPGPGAYNAKLQSTLPQFSIPKSNTSWLKPTLTPGPGSYQPKTQQNSEYNNIKLTKDERKPFYDEKKNIPGPGTYSTHVQKSNPGFKYLLSQFIIGNQKRGDIKQLKHPGPGNYNIPSTISNLPKYNHH